MIPEPEPNLTSRPYRGVSVQEVDIPLTEASIVEYLRGREVYRRTEYLILRHGDDTALVQVAKASAASGSSPGGSSLVDGAPTPSTFGASSDTEPLFSPATDVRVLATPDRVVWVESPATDCGNATALSRAALAATRPGIDAYVVKGLFEHVNFIWRPQPVAVRVTEVIPPGPPKLVEMVEQAIAFDEDLPPILVVPDIVDLEEVLAGIDADGRRYLLPCRGSGVEAEAPIDFLDTRPPDAGPWVMVGCERSAQFYRHFYDREPDRVDLCPRQRPPGPAANGHGAHGSSPGGSSLAHGAPTPLVPKQASASGSAQPVSLVKCCLIERGVEFDPGTRTACVPWGSNLDEVRLALRLLTGLAAPDVPVPYGPEDSPARTARISSP